MSKSEIELVAEVILESIKTGYEVDCQSYTDNYGNIIRTIFLKNGKPITLSKDEFSKVYEEVWKKLI
jgi:hypothetical protein